MKRTVVLLLFSITCLVCVAQEKLFKTAISNGAGVDGFYTINNTSSKYSIDDFRSFANKNGYYLDPNYKSKTISRFGDVATQITTIRFIPKSDYLSYINYALSRGWTSKPFKEYRNSQNASAMLYFYPNGNKNIGDLYYYQYDNVYWSGDWDEGRISGTGSGLAFNNEWYVAFKGIFHKGYPSGKVVFRWLSRKNVDVVCDVSKIQEMTSNSGTFHDDMAWFEIGGKYGFIDAASRTLINPQFGSVIDDFMDTPSGSNYAVVKNNKDGLDWKMNRSGSLFAYSDAQQKKIDDEKAATERAKREAEAKAAEERRIAEEKAEEERRLAEEKRLAYLQKIKPYMDKNKWQRGDRLCLEFGREGQFVTGTLEEWNGDKSKCRIKIVTSPNGNMSYNGDLLTKNNLIWIPTSGEGWHKALPEEIEAANRQDNSIYTQSISTLAKCPECSGTGYVEYTYNESIFGIPLGSRTGTRKCSRCDGTGFIMKSQTVKSL